MFNRRDIIYLYDGSFEGLLTAVFESFSFHEIPMNILVNSNVQETLDMNYYYVNTDTEKAYRVQKSITQKISRYTMHNIFFTYLSTCSDKEMKILAYIHRCFKYGKSVNSRINDKYVGAVCDAALSVGNEAHKLKGFIRFLELSNGVYYGKISPKARILPALILHFKERFNSMPFIIHDLTHEECLVYNGKSAEIYKTDTIPKLDISDNEEHYKALWREFYNTVAIKERHNPKCQMNNMPKRYWQHLTEMELVN